MCGIAGHLSFPVADAEAVVRMTAALVHRGPDGTGLHHDGPIALGHRRLAIIDVVGGAQPLFNEDRTIAVVLNGEIYNYRELAADLRRRHRFATSSDTEVLVHLYEEEGERLLGRLRGMFSFALWDAKRRRLFAARDRLGEKPFLYVEGPGGLWFASEARALAASGVPLGAIDRAALSDYLELLYVPAPRTIWSGVRKLPAGHALIADERGVRTWRYWSPPSPGIARRPLAPGLLRSALEDAVRLRLRSDVPVGALLSGGLDSAAVVGLMARELGPGVRTYSVGFGRPDDELPLARLVAERHRTEHTELLVDDDLAGQTLDALSGFPEPFGDSSAVPTVAVFRLVARHVRVVLTGDGGDELFAGYDRYRTVEWLPRTRLARAAVLLAERLPRFRGRSSVVRGARAAAARGGERNRALVEVFSAREREALLGERSPPVPFGPPAPAGTTDVDAAIAFDLSTYLPDDLLVKVDMASMRFGLEARCPLLDPVLAEHVVPQPSTAKQEGGQGKLLLRAAVGDLVPEEVLAAPKRGFGSPVEQWLRGPVRPILHDLVGNRGARVRSMLDPDAIDRVLADVASGAGNAHQAWALLALEAWARRWP